MSIGLAKQKYYKKVLTKLQTAHEHMRACAGRATQHAGLKPWSFCATIYIMKNERCAALREVLMRARRCGGFVFSLLVSLLFSLEGFVPALILVGLHFILGWSLWWAALAAAVWIAIVALRVAFISWAARCGNTPVPPQENKNPYSVRKTEFGKRSETPGEDADRRDK